MRPQTSVPWLIQEKDWESRVAGRRLDSQEYKTFHFDLWFLAQNMNSKTVPVDKVRKLMEDYISIYLQKLMVILGLKSLPQNLLRFDSFRFRAAQANRQAQVIRPLGFTEVFHDQRHGRVEDHLQRRFERRKNMEKTGGNLSCGSKATLKWHH